MTKIYIYTDYIPHRCYYIIAGKRYEATPIDDKQSSLYKVMFEGTTEGNEDYVNLKKSVHLNYRDWIVEVTNA